MNNKGWVLPHQTRAQLFKSQTEALSFDLTWVALILPNEPHGDVGGDGGQREVLPLKGDGRWRLGQGKVPFRSSVRGGGRATLHGFLVTISCTGAHQPMSRAFCRRSSEWVKGQMRCRKRPVLLQWRTLPLSNVSFIKASPSVSSCLLG